MSAPNYAAVAARLLRRAPQAPPPEASAETRGLETIQRALAARKRQRVLTRGVAIVSLVAAAAAAAIVVPKVLPSAPAVTPPDGLKPVSVSALQGAGASVVDAAEQRRTPLRAGAALELGSHVETSEGGVAALRLSTGTELALRGKSRLGVEGRGAVQKFVLDAGTLEASVAKLAAGARFLVETPDAEVEVRGTKFRLTVLETPAAGFAESGTRLDVQEGIVEVRAHGETAQVHAGEHWPASCAGVEASRTRTDVVTPRASRSHSPPATTHRPVPSAEPSSSIAAEPRSAGSAGREAPTASSALAAQTSLFASASHAAQRGDIATALALYQQLTVNHPQSALAENAIVERMRLLKGTSAGEREARRYLAVYPNGFGKLEAQRLLAAP